MKTSKSTYAPAGFKAQMRNVALGKTKSKAKGGRK